MYLRKFYAARIASARRYEPGSRKALEDFRQKRTRAIYGFGEFDLVDACAWRQPGQVNHHSNGVIGGSRELHTIIRS